MNKGELIQAIAARTELPQKHIDQVISAATDIIADAVANDDPVTLVGFGTFRRSLREAREGRNPATGQTIAIPRRYVPLFRAGKALKDRVS